MILLKDRRISILFKKTTTSCGYDRYEVKQKVQFGYQDDDDDDVMTSECDIGLSKQKPLKLYTMRF